MRPLKKNIDGFTMYLDEMLTGTSGSLATMHHIEPELMWMFKHECRGGLGIDAGASIGDTTLPMAKYLKRVIAFEPDKRSWKLLKRNIEANKLQNRVEARYCALSDKCGESIIFINRHSDKSTLHKSRDGTYKENIVPTITLDSMDVLPDFIKMDIEGFEVEAILGGLNCLKKAKLCKLLIDVHPDTYSETHDFNTVLNNLMSFGFHFRYLISAGKAIPEPFKYKGYKPQMIFKYGEYERGLYDNVSQDDCFSFCALPQTQLYDGKMVNKIVRTALLVKE